MAGNQVFDIELERIGKALKSMREAGPPTAATLAKSARELQLPDTIWLDSEEERLLSEASERQAIESALARLIAGVAADIDIRKREFDDRELPTRSEKLIGVISKAAMHRRQQMRWRDPAALRAIEALLNRVDRLVGLVCEEHALMLAQRKESEGNLITFVDHRPEILDKLRGETGDAMTRVEAVGRNRRCVSVFQIFVDALNTRVATCNILRQKLVTDAEDLLILYQVSAEAGKHEERPMPDGFPNLTSEMERFSTGMLTIDGLDRRRARADLAFAERFPTAAAAREEATKAKAVKRGWRFPTLADFRLARS